MVGRWFYPPYGSSCRRRERGLVLVLAIFAVALLLVLSIGLTAIVRAEIRASTTYLERAQALFLAEAGISQMRAILLYEDPNVDTLQDAWGPDAAEPLDAPQALGDGYYRTRVYDACGRLDINTVNFTALTQLTGSAALAQSIIDWRGSGQETDYYRSLAYPYLPRRGAFQSVGELLLVKGMTPDIYFGTPTRPGLRDLVTTASPSPNTTAEGYIRIPLNDLFGYGVIQDWAQRLVVQYDGLTVEDLQKVAAGLDLLQGQGTGYTSLAQLVEAAQFYQAEDLERVVDYFTVQPVQFIAGKINANTAPVEVLASLPGSSQALAEAIIAERDKQPFEHLGQVAKVLVDNGGLQTFEQVIDFLTTKSSCFIIDSMGYTKAGHGFRRLRVFAYRTKNQVVMLQQNEEDVPLPSPAAVVMQNALSRRSRRAPS